MFYKNNLQNKNLQTKKKEKNLQKHFFFKNMSKKFSLFIKKNHQIFTNNHQMPSKNHQVLFQKIINFCFQNILKIIPFQKKTLSREILSVLKSK